ncbi:MAG: hypothetical protein CVV05_06495 [Gammaproteobacteria bacterium HGW-Gammaproteobacteria-1]|jgi:uncharacterized membrane protein|nr:MAG: hypothetical protein CVV05_06495 [Gammaproteobacteria bacterium HGW-Gammaproteobacteria-1]
MSPFRSPHKLLLFIVAVAFLLGVLQVGLVSIAFDKLGLSQQAAFLLLFSSLAGSMINLPLFSVRAEQPPEPPPLPTFWPVQLPPFTGRTLIAVNAGGCLIPLTFSLYLLLNNPLPLFDALFGIAAIATVSYYMSRPIAGLGIGMPVFIAPISAALVAILLNPEQSAPLAYISGTLGVLIGADLLRLKDIRHIGAPVASIGGAGTFDGIFITGIVAVLLA